MSLKRFKKGAFHEKVISEEEILSIRRGEITTKINFPDGEVLVSKCFNPEVYRENNPSVYQEYYHTFFEEKPLGADSYPHFPPKYYFNKETNMLDQINGLGEDNFAPRLIGTCPSEDRLLLEYIPEVTCQQAVTSYKKKDVLTYMLNVASEIHQRENKKLGIFLEKGKGSRIFRVRSKDEERQRLRHYLEIIICYRSAKFRDFCENRGVKTDSELTRKQIKELISSFAVSNLNNSELHFHYANGLAGFTDWFINEKRAMLYHNQDEESSKKKINEAIRGGLISVIHGDLHPRNIFMMGEKNIRVCDFAHSRLGSRYTDLGTILYEPLFCPTSLDEEISTLELLALYVEQVNKKEGIDLNFREVTRKSLVSRLEESMRLYSIYCRYTDRERERFLPKGLTNGMKELYNYTKRKEDFLDWTYNLKIGKLFSYFSRGEGWEKIIGSALDEEGGRRLHNILIGTQESLEALGVIEKSRAEEERDSRFQKIGL